MTEPNSETKQEHAARRATASKARRAADKATAPVAGAAKSAADKADDAASAAKSGAERSADTVGGAAHGAARGVEAGRQALVATTGQVAATAKAATGQVAATAKTAWTVIAHRKLIAAGVGAGVTVLTAASYAAGRRSGRHTHGPITRLTGGRI
ncbi:hypothetical protein ACIBVL_42080 [Streptomyces sp. NPDC049687]|uniref:hypothetical protein n=1 Tax=Streptomyces sp. NPDC049687 TaxID=3365596 RepID=UPI0037A715CB